MNIVIYGTTNIAKIICFYMQQSEKYNIVAFAADSQYINSDNFLEKPLYDFDKIEKYYNPKEFKMLVLGPFDSPQKKKNMFDTAKSKGYSMINYIQEKAIVSPDLIIGENNVIFNGAYLDCFGKIGDNNVIRPNVYLGHNFEIGSHIYISPGCNIAGYCKINDLSVIGIGTTIMSRKTIAKQSFIGAHSLVLKDTEEKLLYMGSPAKKIKRINDEWREINN